MLRKSYVTPRNYGREKSVQEEIHWTISRANAQYQTAIQPDGVPVLFWKKTDEGNFCTCRFGRTLANKIGSDNLSNPENQNGQFVAEDLGSLDSRDEYLGGDETDYSVKNQWDADRALQVRGADRYYASDNEDVDPTRPQLRDDQLPQPEEESDFLSGPVDSDTLFGIERTQCGICLGTGKTQAWNLFNGRREIFDSYNVRGLDNFKLDLEAHPVAFRGHLVPGSYVEWHWTLPTYFNKVYNFAVRNNTKSVRYLKIFYKIADTNTEFQRLTEEFLNSRRGTPTHLILRVMPIRDAMDEAAEFTHLEISLELSKPQKIQMTPLSVASNDQVNAVSTTSSFTFPPTFNNIDRGDVFLDTKYGYVWKVTDFTDFQTAQRQVLGWTVSGRNLQPFEQLALLKVAYDKYYETSYAGLESLQGSLLSGSDLL